MKTKLILLFICLFVGLSTQAQGRIVYDEQKYKQWNSMENGDWDFAPDWYYYTTHKNYSGAHWKWEWKGFKSGPVIRFDENDSNVKRVITDRLLQLELAKETKKKTQAELDTITPIHNEELARMVDRNVDVAYSQYKNEFQELQASITSALSYCLEKSKGRLTEAVALIQNQNDILLSNINYIHKEGEGYELENTKRQIAYEEALETMKKIANTSVQLMVYTKCHY